MLFVCCDDAIPRGVAAGAGAEDAVRLQHRGDRAAAVHVRSERAQAPGARARPAARGRRPTSRRRRSRRCGRGCPACTRCSTCCSTRATSPRTPSRRSAASCATKPSGSPRCWPSTRWARSRRPSRCSRSCTSTRPGWARASTGWEACCCSRSRTGRCGIASGSSSAREWLERAASGEVFSRFHAEAGIAAEHCFAPSFARDALEGDRRPLRDAGAHRPVAAAHAEPRGRRRRVAGRRGRARARCEGLVPPAWLAGSYLWDAVLGDLHRRAGQRRDSRAATASGPWPRRPRKRCAICCGAGSPSPARTDGARTGRPLVPTNQSPQSVINQAPSTRRK